MCPAGAEEALGGIIRRKALQCLEGEGVRTKHNSKHRSVAGGDLQAYCKAAAGSCPDAILRGCTAASIGVFKDAEILGGTL